VEAGRGGGGSSSALQPQPGGQGGQGAGIFASFVQRRRTQQGKASGGAAGDTAGGFIKLNPTYEHDFMGGKVAR